MSNRWITTIGGMAYSIYLLHNPLIEFLSRFSRVLVVGTAFLPNLLLQMALLLPAVLVVSVGFYVLVERPCMERDWPSRLRARLSGTRTERRGKDEQAPAPVGEGDTGSR